MAQTFAWDRGFFSPETGEFDRALVQLRRNAAVPAANPHLLANLAVALRNQHGITRREFDRRFRLVVSTVFEHDPASIGAIAAYLGETCPEALNSLRTLLPAQMKHLGIRHPTAVGGPITSVPPPPDLDPTKSEAVGGRALGNGNRQ